MIITKYGGIVDRTLRVLGIKHAVTVEAENWIEAAELYTIQKKLEISRSGIVDDETLTPLADLLICAKLKEGVKSVEKGLADLLGPETTPDAAAAEVRRLCEAGYISEEDLDGILLAGSTPEQ